MALKFWVFDWLRDNGITSQSEAAAALSASSAIGSLRKRAEAYTSKRAQLEAKGSQAVLAGTGIDFVGGETTCPSPACMRRQVDELFKHVWHYFDRIVVTDVFTPNLLEPPQFPDQELIEILVTHLPPLFYVQELGAEHLIEFVPKVACEDHWQHHAEEEGLGEVLKTRNALTCKIKESGEFYYENSSFGEPGYWISVPGTDTTTGIPLSRFPHHTEEQLRSELASLVFAENFKALTFDVTTAHQLKIPLGSVIGIHEDFLSAGNPPAVAEVVFRLDLPVLAGVSTRDLIKLREDEHDSFLQFRTTLKKAVTERIRTAGSARARSVASEIQNDLIEPALERIRIRLKASERALARKSGVTLFLGVLGTTCGVLCGAPPVVALPAGFTVVIAGINNAAQKHIDELREASLEDMYFLWKASSHQH